MNARKVQRVDFSASDWLGGTATLSLQESGLYITICALIYVAGGPVSKADIRKVVASVRSDTFSSILLRLIEKGKISFENGLIDQVRCERELARARRRIASRSQTGVESNPDGSDPSADSASRSDAIVSDREPLVLNEINPVTTPLTHVKGATHQPTKDLESYPESSESGAARARFAKSGELGRFAPSGESPKAPEPEPAEVAAGPPTPEDKAYVEALVEQTTAALRGDLPKGIRDPVAYKAAIKDAKFTSLVRNVNAWVGTALSGEAQWAAWEVLDAAEKAGVRSGMTRATRKDFDKLVAMHRATGPPAELERQAA